MSARLLSGVVSHLLLCSLFLQAQARSPFEEEERLKTTIAAAQDPVILEQAFRSLIDGYLQREDCELAQEWLHRARERKAIHQFVSYLLAIGSCLEKRFPERARLLYLRIIVDYPDESDEIGDKYADSARRRLIWLSNDRSWVIKTRVQLVRLIRTAVQRHDFGSLRKYVSKVNFIFGACESEFLNSNLEEVAAFLDENYRARIRVAPAVQKFPYHEGWFMLETRGWSAPYNYVYFLVQQIPGGWEWIGGIYCDESIVHKVAVSER
ncbi:MAG TPA: hypothetical protein VGQ81_07975 [Acidobacteriota bacterium]|jgi:hypothetical protein|nr:hypothetical protein [Acidobacteriota bacterium]